MKKLDDSLVLRSIIILLVVMLPILLTFAATSCGSTKTITTTEVPVYIHDTTKVVQMQHDSTYIDRWHTEYIKGDTIFVTDSQIVVKWLVRTDTAVKYVEKPVEVVVEKVKEKKRIPWYAWLPLISGVITFVWAVWYTSRKE